MPNENRVFTAALIVSMLTHIVVLWWGQRVSLIGEEKSLTAANRSVTVALMPASMMQEESAVQPENKHQETAKTPTTHLPEPVESDIGDEQISASSEAAGAAEKSVEGKASGASEPAVQGGGAVDSGARDQYLATVLAQIESHKFYPLSARRRGLEGRVEVYFMLDAQGKISDLHVSGSNTLFVEAARAAVQNAIPLPKTPSIDGFPLSVSYQMIFQLQ